MAEAGVGWVRGFSPTLDPAQTARSLPASIVFSGILEYREPADPAAWQQYVRDRVRTFRPLTRHWEVWNEPPNFTSNTPPEVYGQMVAWGGINTLWPLFGITNQLLAAIALCVATTILIKMHGAKYMWITCTPLTWLVIVCYTAAWQKIFSPIPRIGFLAQADQLQGLLDAGKVSAAKLAETQTVIFNNRLDAVVCGLFLVLVTTILVDSVILWAGILRCTREARISETPFVMSQLRAEEVWSGSFNSSSACSRNWRMRTPTSAISPPMAASIPPRNGGISASTG